MTDPKSAKTTPSESQLQARISHLNMVQTIIGRVAGYSATVKTFNLTIVAALIAVAFDKELPVLLMAGMGVTTVFLVLDAYYLSLERKFRDLHGEIVKQPWVEAFDLDIKHGGSGVLNVLGAMRSVSVWGYYAPLLGGLAVLASLSMQVQPEPNAGGKAQHAAAVSPAQSTTPAKVPSASPGSS